MSDITKKKIDAVNLDNAGKILTAEAKIIGEFLKNRKSVLDKNGRDATKEGLAGIHFAMVQVIAYLSDRVNVLEQDIKKSEEDK